MTLHQQHLEQRRENHTGRNSSRPAKVCWVTFLSIGLCLTQLSPVFARNARNAFNSPMVPSAASHPYASPHVRRAEPVHRSRRVVRPTRRSDRSVTSTRRSRPSRRVVGPTRRSTRSFTSTHRSFLPSVTRRSIRSQHHHFPRGRRFTALPLGYAAIMLANDLYYYYSGNFYRPASRGYVVVDPPVGAVVSTLPADYSFLSINGAQYYTSAGNYYLQVPHGYQVVSAPRMTAPQPVVGNKVVVTSSMLNVRSGPGLQHYIASRVYNGDVLQVLQRNADWVYVQLPDNSQGWVMTQFVAPAGQRTDRYPHG